MSSATDVEEIMKRITSHKGVSNMMVINKNGLPLYTTMEITDSTDTQIKNIHELAIAARRMVRDLDPKDDLMFLRTSSSTFELLISPDTDFTVVVIQDKL
ncbi:unnamed protein product [Lymnaea stagnalis]|uniref:Dynein light chain roadblock n=1 Tax=Lymnaea stagnalis TaxID=6523 RepID=A0AAV2I7C0_LYMST